MFEIRDCDCELGKLCLETSKPSLVSGAAFKSTVAEVGMILKDVLDPADQILDRNASEHELDMPEDRDLVWILQDEAEEWVVHVGDAPPPAMFLDEIANDALRDGKRRDLVQHCYRCCCPVLFPVLLDRVESDGVYELCAFRVGGIPRFADQRQLDFPTDDN